MPGQRLSEPRRRLLASTTAAGARVGYLSSMASVQRRSVSNEHLRTGTETRRYDSWSLSAADVSIDVSVGVAGGSSRSACGEAAGHALIMRLGWSNDSTCCFHHHVQHSDVDVAGGGGRLHPCCVRASERACVQKLCCSSLMHCQANARDSEVLCAGWGASEPAEVEALLESTGRRGAPATKLVAGDTRASCRAQETYCPSSAPHRPLGLPSPTGGFCHTYIPTNIHI